MMLVRLLLLIAVLFSTSPAYHFEEHGKASYYADRYQDRPTASGELYHPDSLTAAHRTLPFGTQVTVVNPHTQQQVVVKINDRGPHTPGRIIDLSRRAADSLGIVQLGIAQVILKAEPTVVSP